jgi:hypothetical protein
MTVRMENGISNMDRHVIINLDTKTPEKYTVYSFRAEMQICS